MMLDNSYFFFFNDPATTETYPLSLHAALPIYGMEDGWEYQSARDLNATSCPPQSPAVDYPTPCLAAKPYPGKKPYTNPLQDRKSTRLNSSHANISYAVFCLKKKIQTVNSPSPS